MSDGNEHEQIRPQRPLTAADAPATKELQLLVDESDCGTLIELMEERGATVEELKAEAEQLREDVNRALQQAALARGDAREVSQEVEFLQSVGLSDPTKRKVMVQREVKNRAEDNEAEGRTPAGVMSTDEISDLTGVTARTARRYARELASASDRMSWEYPGGSQTDYTDTKRLRYDLTAGDEE